MAQSDEDSLPHITYADSSTHLYVVRGGDSLFLNFYRPVAPRVDSATVVYLYGGAFIFGHRNDMQTRRDADALLRRGYNVAAIDYRKFFAGIDFDTVAKCRMLDMLDSAFNYAAADCAAAVAYLCAHAGEMGIATNKVILCGSSAGAIAVLQLDFARCNAMEAASELPAGFRPAAVVAYAGAIFNHHGSLDYQTEPAPTAFFYGQADKVVPYRKISLFSAHYAGSDGLIDRFDDKGYTFWAFRYKDHGHEVAGYLYRTLQEFDAFADAALAGRRLHYDTQCSADELTITKSSKLTLRQLMTATKITGLFDDDSPTSASTNDQ